MDEHSSTTSPTLEALEVLRGGREKLLSGTWVKRDPDGGSDEENCALSAVCTSIWDASSAESIAVEALNRSAASLFPQRTAGNYPQVAATVNDHLATSFNDVISIYDEAERILKDRLASEVTT